MFCFGLPDMNKIYICENTYIILQAASKCQQFCLSLLEKSVFICV